MSKTIIVAVVVSLMLAIGIGAEAAASLAVRPNHGPVGSEVTLSATGLPASTAVKILWQTYGVDWDLSQYEGVYSGVFRGRTIKERIAPLSSAKTGADGTLAVAVHIPEDIGGQHTIYVSHNDKLLVQAAFRTDMTATFEPQSGPVGTPITIRVTGLDTSHNISGWYQVFYDNKLTGFLTAVTTDGTAKAVIPATGNVGKHVLQLQNAPFGSAYRALETSPYAWLPTPDFAFEVTEGDPVLPPPIEEQIPPTVRADKPATTGGPLVWTNIAKGGVGTPMVLRGEGLPAGKDVKLMLYSKRGSRVTAAGFTEVSDALTTVHTDADGAFEWATKVPDALGGIHKLTAAVEDKDLAQTHFAVAPTAFPLEPVEGPVNTTVTMHLEGVGWTQTENIFAITYDNSFIGYACGFSTDGQVLVFLKATGEPGWHFIDIYPSFYRNKAYEEADQQPFLYRFPILTWQDHPQPIHYRYAFKVTAEYQ